MQAAQLLSVLYALLMMAVLVGIMISIVEDGPSSPTALSFFFVAFCFIFAAILHPQVLKYDTAITTRAQK